MLNMRRMDKTYEVLEPYQTYCRQSTVQNDLLKGFRSHTHKNINMLYPVTETVNNSHVSTAFFARPALARSLCPIFSLF